MGCAGPAFPHEGLGPGRQRGDWAAQGCHLVVAPARLPGGDLRLWVPTYHGLSKAKFMGDGGQARAGLRTDRPLQEEQGPREAD